MFVVILLIFINRKLVPDADKGSPIGIKTQRITELGESAVLDMDIQFDATDIDRRNQGTGRRREMGGTDPRKLRSIRVRPVGEEQLVLGRGVDTTV